MCPASDAVGLTASPDEVRGPAPNQFGALGARVTQRVLPDPGFDRLPSRHLRPRTPAGRGDLRREALPSYAAAAWHPMVGS